MGLFDDLTRIGRQVESQLRQMKNNETATVHVSVLPFVRALGYNTQDLSEVYPEYAILNMDAVDLAVMREGEPIIVLEAKKAGEKLSSKHWKQLFEYFNADKACIGILTNGLEYCLYTDIIKPNIMDKDPFLTINLRHLDMVSVAQLDGFSKGRFHPEHSLRKIKVSNLLARELRQPSDEFVRFFAKQIHNGSVWQNVIEEFRPIVKKSWDDLIDQHVARRPQRHETQADEPVPDHSTVDSTGKTYIDIPVLDGSVEIPVYASWKGHEFTTKLSLCGKVANVGNIVFWDGEWMTPLQAGKRSRMTVDPNATHYVSGMKYWQLRDPADGKLRPINDIHYYEDLLPRVLRNANP